MVGPFKYWVDAHERRPARTGRAVGLLAGSVWIAPSCAEKNGFDRYSCQKRSQSCFEIALKYFHVKVVVRVCLVSELSNLFKVIFVGKEECCKAVQAVVVACVVARSLGECCSDEM